MMMMIMMMMIITINKRIQGGASGKEMNLDTVINKNKIHIT